MEVALTLVLDMDRVDGMDRVDEVLRLLRVDLPLTPALAPSDGARGKRLDALGFCERVVRHTGMAWSVGVPGIVPGRGYWPRLMIMIVGI